MADILVLDDEIETCETVKEILSADGHRVITACNGTAGLAYCHQFDFDLVITDLIMPGEDGFEVIQKLRAINANLPIIAMTAEDSADEYGYLELAAQFGANRCLKKPFDVSELQSVVEHLLHKEGASLDGS